MPPSTRQTRFHRCQKCGSMVDKVYQLGYCKTCLTEHFNRLRPFINVSHAEKDGSTFQTLDNQKPQ